MKRKILVTTGTRADYGIYRELLFKINESKKLELILIVTGSHLLKKHGLTVNEIKLDGFKINAKIKINPKDDDMFSSSIELGKSIIEFSKIFKKFKPDINIILGDRDEMLASTIAASHMNIISAHIAGGDISGGLDEYNRHAITKLSNIHFTSTKTSKERIIRMGENPNLVFNVGSLSIDQIIKGKITSRKDLEKKYGLQFTNNEILLLQHPVTTEVEKTKNQIKDSLDALIKTKKPILAIAPNMDPGNKIIFKNLEKEGKKHKKIKYIQNVPRTDYLGFLQNCRILIGNSSSGIIESTMFNIQIINLGIRQSRREKENSIIDIKKPTSKKIFNEIIKIFKSEIYKEKNKIYGNGNTAKKIQKYLENIPLNKKLIQKQFND
jgi:GDP/UDP-N,N'-diacetylbacillosamine 2-epimerase (hydrolysing)